MAKKARKEKKGLLDKAIDAVSSRDEKAAAEEAKGEASAARAKAAHEASKRRVTESKLERAEKKAEAAQKAAAEAEAKLARAEREKRADAVREKLARPREEMAAATQKRVYVVKSGDSLSKIAKEVYGEAKRWPEIFEANKDQIKDPNMIHPGQELKIP
jgi:nucleoid-associated protein YgaU